MYAFNFTMNSLKSALVFLVILVDMASRRELILTPSAWMQHHTHTNIQLLVPHWKCIHLFLKNRTDTEKQRVTLNRISVTASRSLNHKMAAFMIIL